MIIVKNITLSSDSTWEEVVFDKVATKYQVKNLSDAEVIVSLIEDDEDDNSVTIVAGGTDTIFMSEKADITTNAIYLKGVGDVEIRQLDAALVPTGVQLVGLNVEALDSRDCEGKDTDDLQADIVVAAIPSEYINHIYGTLKYVDEYTGYSDDPTEQEGNYLALHIESEDGAVTTVQYGDADATELEADDMIVIRVTDLTKKLKFVTTKGNVTHIYWFTLADLILEEPEEEA